MARVTVEDCLPLVDNRFALVLLATKRARQLMAGARPLIEAKDKPPVLALREVATGKVRLIARCARPSRASTTTRSCPSDRRAGKPGRTVRFKRSDYLHSQPTPVRSRGASGRTTTLQVGPWALQICSAVSIRAGLARRGRRAGFGAASTTAQPMATVKSAPASSFMSGRPVSGGPGHGTLCERGELFPTRQAVEAPRVAEQCVEPARAHVAGFPRAGARGGERGGQTVPLALGRREARAQHALLEQTAPELP